MRVEGEPLPPGTALETVLAYHARTRHRLDRYAPGPETLDWDAQPDPFRRFAGAPLHPLPLAAARYRLPWARLAGGGDVPAQPLGRATVGALLELSFALAAWKQFGPDRWALRCAPSSGNLHPTEAYLVTRAVPGLADGLYHYAPREHALEHRCQVPAATGEARLYLGLSAIHWREAWKYGERAFRYCLLDLGHALGALRYAAAVLGWRLRLVTELDGPGVARRLGLDRAGDFAGAEGEDADWLVEILPGAAATSALPPPVWPADACWLGRANRLDPRPLYHWPAIGQVAAATVPQAGPPLFAPAPPASGAAVPSSAQADAVALIRNRRSAQRFDKQATVDAAVFYRLAAALLPAAGLPWDVWPWAPRVHPVFFIHRVDGLAPGVYALPRTPEGEATLRRALQVRLAACSPEGCPPALPLRLLAEGVTAGLLRKICCHQALAADCMFGVALLAEYQAPLEAAPWHYRLLHQEAGLLGHALYLEAEAAGLRGTGIGCYFDEHAHGLLGVGDSRLQVLYHFTVGLPLTDARITSEPAYAGRPSVPE